MTSKYKRKLFLRREKIEVAVNAKGKNEDTRYQLRISNLHRQDFQEQEEMLDYRKSERIRINRHWTLKTALSTKNTNFTLMGEKIGLLVCDDGRYIRIHHRDFTRADLRKLKHVLFEQFATDKEKASHKARAGARDRA